MLEGGYSSLVSGDPTQLLYMYSKKACTLAPISVYHFEDTENKACSSRKTVGVHSAIFKTNSVPNSAINLPYVRASTIKSLWPVPRPRVF